MHSYPTPPPSVYFGTFCFDTFLMGVMAEAVANPNMPVMLMEDLIGSDDVANCRFRQQLRGRCVISKALRLPW